MYLNPLKTTIQWGPGKIVHNLIGSSMTYKLSAWSNAYDTNLGSHTHDVLPIATTEIIVHIWSQDPREQKILLLKKSQSNLFFKM